MSKKKKSTEKWRLHVPARRNFLWKISFPLCVATDFDVRLC